MEPKFPNFKPLELNDQDQFRKLLWAYQPQTSEWTFTNLFIWRQYFGFEWSLDGDNLLLIAAGAPHGPYAMQPIGPGSRRESTLKLLLWLREEKGQAQPRLERADARLVAELQELPELSIEADRNQFDYLYQTAELIALAGRKLHTKKNYLNRIRREHPEAVFAPLSPDLIPACQAVAGEWCQLHRCADDLGLSGEWEAIHEALEHFEKLGLEGGVIRFDDEIKAFSLGERLNEQTAVIHIEKADPTIPGLYTLMNQQFAEKNWATVPQINREQDLGDEGLRFAKLSYCPDQLIEKFRITLNQ